MSAPQPERPGSPLALDALVATTLTSVALAATGFAANRSNYAGVSNDQVTEFATSAYRDFLLSVVGVSLGTAAVLGVMLAPVTLGLAFALGPRLPPGRRRRWLVLTALATAAVLTFTLLEAHQHPGLFLVILASSAPLTWLTKAAFGLVSLVGGAAVGGYGRRLGQRFSPAHVAGALWLPAVVALGVGAGRLASPPPAPFRTAQELPLPPEHPGTVGDDPDVLIVAVDSLRPDRISPETTPNLARLLGESAYFPNTLVTLPRTGPSWVATLTSLPPLLNGVETMFPDAGQQNLAPFALPAQMASRGYRTAAFSEYAGEFFGRVDLGFQLRSVPTVELREISGQMALQRAPTVVAAIAAAYEWPWSRRLLPRPLEGLVRGLANFAHPDVLADDVLATIRSDRMAFDGLPLFGLLFYSQPHFPYSSSYPYWDSFSVPGSSSNLSFGRDGLNETAVTSAADLKQLDGLYRGALAETDAALGRLIERLTKVGRYDSTILILVADHGEGLYECPTCSGHGDNLRGGMTLQVPLAFHLPPGRFPKFKPGKNEAWVSQLDLYPTLLSVLGAPPIATHEGMALLDRNGVPVKVPQRTHFVETGEWLWPTGAVPADRIAYPPITEMAAIEHDRIVIPERYLAEIRAAKHRAVIRYPYKLTYEPGRDAVHYHLFRMDKDPLDTHDLVTLEPHVRASLQEALFQHMTRHPKILPVDGYFLSRPAPPPEEDW